MTRITRTTTAKDSENANARPSRITTRAKPAALAAATAATGGTSRATAGTAASRAKMNAHGDTKAEVPVGKRKREALGEVTGLMTNNKPAGKGKDKEDLKKDLKRETFDGVVIKSKPVSTRQSLRTVAGTRQTTRTTTSIIKQNAPEDVKKVTGTITVQDENAMIVDAPAQTIPSITVRRSLVSKEYAATAIRRSDATRTSIRSVPVAQRQVVEDEEASRVFKKRRTSSEAPEEDPAALEEARQLAAEEEATARLTAEIEAYAEEPEADPEGSQWEDLDADDSDDPLMVSEYVIDIFNYLKQIEVCTRSIVSLCLNLTHHI